MRADEPPAFLWVFSSPLLFTLPRSPSQYSMIQVSNAVTRGTLRKQGAQQEFPEVLISLLQDGAQTLALVCRSARVIFLGSQG